jgi:hypothetical protein
MEEYSVILGVKFVQTIDAPLGHVKIHPLVFADFLRAAVKLSTDPLDIFIHKGVPHEPSLEEKVKELEGQ